MARTKCLFPMLLATIVCFILHFSICQENPGIRVQITKRGLDYVNDLSLKKMYEELRSYTFPTSSKGHFSLRNVRVSQVSMPTGDVSLVPGTGLRWSVGIEGYKLSADVRYSRKIAWVKVRKTFSLSMDIRSLSLQLTLKATEASNGGLSLKAVNCDSNANVRVSSSNVILKVVLPFFRSKINGLIKKKLCDSAMKIVNNNISPKLSNYPLTRQIKDGYIFDYRFVSDPVFTSAYMQTNHKAAVMTTNQTSNFPFSPKPLPIVNEDKNMIYFIISDFVLNTWLYTAYRDGKFLLKVTKEKFKTEEQQRMLRTYCPESFCIGTFFPPISEGHPNGTVEIIFSTSAQPTIQFEPNLIHLGANVTLNFNVLTSDGKSVNFLSSNLTFSSELKTDIAGLNILFTIMNTTVEEDRSAKSSPASLDHDLLHKFVSTVVHIIQAILPGTSFPLTVPSNTMLRNTTLEIAQNALIVSSDLAISSI